MPRTPDEVRKAKREGMARQRALNPEYMRRRQNQWYHRNRDRVRAQQAALYARRFFWARAGKLRGDRRAIMRALARMWRRQRGRCALTGRRLGRNAQLDHIRPISRGGSDKLSNIRWVCPEVNMAKRDLTDAEFFALCRDVMQLKLL